MIKYRSCDNDIDITKLLNEGWKIIGQTWCGERYGLQTSMIFNNLKDRKIPIDMWVARDIDKELYLYFFLKPEKTDTNWIPDYEYIKIPNDLYPDVKWSDNEPLKIN